MREIFNYKNDYIKFSLLIFSIGLCILVYLPGLPGDFVHDDFPNIVKNDNLQINSLNIDSLISASFSTKSGPLKRPLSMLSFAINHYFSKLDPQAYKITNIIIHTLTGLFLFFLTRLLLNSCQQLSKNNTSTHKNFYIALLIATAWMVSPINLTSVLYVVQRMTSLSALFSVMGICCYVIGRRSMILNQKLNFKYFILSGFLLILSVLSKESGALSLFYLILIEIFFFKFNSNCIISKKLFKTSFLTITCLPIILAAAFLFINSGYILNGFENRYFSLEERVLTQTRLIFLYLKWILVPNISELGLFHDDIPLSESIFVPFTTLFSAFSLFILTTASIALRQRAPLISFAILFFLASHLLESTIIPLEIVYEHRNYLASFGIIFGIIATIFYCIKSRSNNNLAIFICCLWITSLAYSTATRSYQWKDITTLAYYDVSHHPKSARANFELGRAYANLAMAEILDNKEKAITLFEKSMELMPYEIAGEAAAIRYSGIIGQRAKQKWVDNIIGKTNSFPITHITVESLKEINICFALSCSITIAQAFEIYKAAISTSIPAPIKHKSDVLTLYGEFSANHMNDLDVAYNAMKESISLIPDELQYRINFIMLTIIMDKHDEALDNIKFVEENDTYKLHAEKISNLKKDLQSNMQNNNQ